MKIWIDRFQYCISFIASLGIHGILLAFLFFSMDTALHPKRLPQKQGEIGEIVQAVAIDETRVQEEVNRLKKIEQDVATTHAREQAQLADMKLAQEKAHQQLKELKLQQEKAKKHLMALDDERAAEQERVKQMRMEREKEEKKRNEINKQQLEEKRNKEAAKRTADLNAAKAAEQVRAAHDERMISEMDRIVGIWKDKIEDNRREAIGMSKDLSCRLAITVLPDGSVQVKLVQSSGNSVYDDLSVKAVYKSQPFPLPEDPVIRERVKSLELNFLNDQGVDNA